MRYYTGLSLSEFDTSVTHCAYTGKVLYSVSTVIQTYISNINIMGCTLIYILHMHVRCTWQLATYSLTATTLYIKTLTSRGMYVIKRKLRKCYRMYAMRNVYIR